MVDLQVRWLRAGFVLLALGPTPALPLLLAPSFLAQLVLRTQDVKESVRKAAFRTLGEDVSEERGLFCFLVESRSVRFFCWMYERSGVWLLEAASPCMYCLPASGRSSSFRIVRGICGTCQADVVSRLHACITVCVVGGDAPKVPPLVCVSDCRKPAAFYFFPYISPFLCPTWVTSVLSRCIFLHAYCCSSPARAPVRSSCDDDELPYPTLENDCRWHPSTSTRSRG